MYQQNYVNYGTKILPTQGLKGRPVSSLEEARASAIDFDGSVFFFPDLINKRIYTKQINMDGTASLNMYELRELPVETPSSYVTKEELELAIEQLKTSLTQPVVETKPAMPPLNF